MSKSDTDIIGAEHPAVIAGINNMKARGFSKEKTIEVTGAPYELVDRLYQNKNVKKQENPNQHND